MSLTETLRRWFVTASVRRQARKRWSIPSYVPVLETRLLLSGSPLQFVDPHPQTGNQFGNTVMVLTNGNVVITAPTDSAGGNHAGAVYLFNGQTGALISTLIGSHDGDTLGDEVDPQNTFATGGVVALSNGNFVVESPNWNGQRGAVTWGSGTTGVSGVVSSANSLIGTTATDSVGRNIFSNTGGVTALSNGNYVVNSPNWNGSLGAVTFGNGTTGVAGEITSTNSLVGSNQFDSIGSGDEYSSSGITALPSGNYVVNSPRWNHSLGAVTFGNGTQGVVGIITSANSLVGQPDDFNSSSLGEGGITILSNGNYVVDSPFWSSDSILGKGAVTWASGTTGVTGFVTKFNSLVGSKTGDQVGRDRVIALNNGNYVVGSSNWNSLIFAGVGAVTWGSGISGVTGIVSAQNSLIGANKGDAVGFGGMTALSNGNYVVSSPAWNNGSITKAGAVTWGNGATGVTGAVTPANSLVGATQNDQVGGGGIAALSNGNYVVDSRTWNNGMIANAGAVTFGVGTTGVTGTVNSRNSLVGTSANDQVGGASVIALQNGNYVIGSPGWNGSIGAATWGSGTTGVIGTITSTNSLTGSTSGDGVGGGAFGAPGITALANGNYVVDSSIWNNSSGAVTWGSGATGRMGIVGPTNSLVGSTATDKVGSYGITALTNGNYVVDSPTWGNSLGAVTWGSGTNGVFGQVNSMNSLVGSTPGDQVGNGDPAYNFIKNITALSNGNYVVDTDRWTNGSVFRAGAVTFGNGVTGVSGAIASTNSLLGQTSAAGATTITITTDETRHAVYAAFAGYGTNTVYQGSSDKGFSNVNSPNIAVSNASGVLANGTGSVNFGAAVSGTSVMQVITVTNYGNANLIVQPATATGGFTIVNNLATGLSIAPGASANFKVQLNTTTVGTVSGVVTINSNDLTGSPFTFKVTGTVVASQIVVNPASLTLPEGSANGTTAGTVSVTDVGSNPKPIYAITAGNTSGAFAINSTTGQITVANSAALQLATNPSFSLTVQVTDNGSSGSANITIKLARIALSNSLIAENAAVGTTIGQLTTAEAGTGNTFTYALPAGQFDNSDFTINSSGNLLLNGTLNAVIANAESISVISTDQHGLSFTKTFTIVVLGPSDMALSNNIVPQTAAIGSVIGQFTTTDAGTGNSFSYTLPGGKLDNADFVIDANGHLKVNTAFDASVQNRYSVDVVSTDQRGLTFEKVFTINILNKVPSQFVDPHPETGNLFGGSVTVLTNGNVVITASNDDAGGGNTLLGTGTGAVYLYNFQSGALISTLNGSNPGDQLGTGAVTALANGNFVVDTPNWNGGLGAVTFVNGTTGLTGSVSSANSLIGSTAMDQVGSGGVTALTNGKFVVDSPSWNHNTGAVTLGDGTTSLHGTISLSNSLVGSVSGDQSGSGGISALANGNYVVDSPNWSGNRGAVTFANASSGVTGIIGSVNSLVGITVDDQVGSGGIVVLPNGGYVIASPNWQQKGAVTFGSQTGGVRGTVAASNSLVGSVAGDRVGSNGITVLSNGNYVVASPLWSGSMGAVTWGSGVRGVTGIVSVGNSLIGSQAGDNVGGSFTANQSGVTALTNGNYVVASPLWSNHTVSQVGAATWGNGTAGVTGVISATNSLIGTTAKDQVGIGAVTALSNGNYVVDSINWNNGSITDAGAVTWGDGTIGVTGPVSSTNSLVGSTMNDAVGLGDFGNSYHGVTALSNGNYVVDSLQWNNGSVAYAGAVTFGNGMTGVKGTITPTNSLVGVTESDTLGSGGITALSNGNYVVDSPTWSNGNALPFVGAATFGSGTSGVVGMVSSDNSLIGSTNFDNVGAAGVTALSNGNYVVDSPFWSVDILTQEAGAVTWGSGTTGVKGIVGVSNSLIGSSFLQQVGAGSKDVGLQFDGITALANGNYVIDSYHSTDGFGNVVGSVTFGDGTSGVTGILGPDNSLLGQFAQANTLAIIATPDNVHSTVYAAFTGYGASEVYRGSAAAGFINLTNGGPTMDVSDYMGQLLNTDSVSLGTASIGASVAEVVTVTNNGNAPLVLQPVTVSAGFTILNNFSANQSIAPQSSASFIVQLNANGGTALGLSTGIATITSNAGTPSFTFNVSGTVTASKISVQQGSTTLTNGTANVNLGNTLLGQPVTQVITVANTGNAPLLLTSANLPIGYSIVGGINFTTGQSIAPGTSANFTLQLNASATGTPSGIVTITSNDPTASSFTFHVTATVTAPSIGIQQSGTPHAKVATSFGGTGVSQAVAPSVSSPGGTSTVDLGSTVVGTPITDIVTVTNSGNAVLIVQPVIVPVGFSIVAGTNFMVNQAIAIGASASFTLQLNAIAAGTVGGLVTISNNDPTANPFTFLVTGIVKATVTSTVLQAQWRSTTLASGSGTVIFNEIPAGAADTEIITVTNRGSSPLVVQPVTAPGGFQMLQNFSVNQPIAPGDHAILKLQLNAGASGTPTGTLTITSNDPTASSFTVQLVANHAPTDIAIDPNYAAKNQTSNVVVGLLSTTDPDPGQTFTYSVASPTFLSGTTAIPVFTVDGQGLLVLSQGALNGSYPAVPITSTDAGGLSYTKNFDIFITAPSTVGVAASETVASGTPSGITIATFPNSGVQVQDALGTTPTGVNTATRIINVVRYELGNGADNDDFVIDVNGQLQTAVPLDAATKSSYHITINSTNVITGLSTTYPYTITVAPVGIQAPTITAPSAVSMNQNGSLGFTAANAISIADASGTAEQLTLSVSHGTLTLAPVTGLTISGSGTASIMITGSLATLNSSLANLTYSPTVGYYGSDSLVLSNTDTADSLTATGSVAITVNALAPTIAAPASISVNPNGSVTFSSGNSISVTDPSGTAEQLKLSVSHGSLTLAATPGLTITGSGTASITISGVLTTLNTSLTNLLYTPTVGYHGSDTLLLSNKDTVDNLTATGSVAISVNALPPTIIAPTTVSVSQSGSLTFSGANAISVTDPSGTAEQLTLSVSHGTLTLAATTGLTITNSGTASIIVSGAVATLNTGLVKLLYTPTAGYHGADTLVLSNKDTVDNLSATGSVAITVNALPPTIKAPTTASVAQNGSLAFMVINAISVTDPSGTAEQLTLSVSQGTLTLAATTGLTISGSGTASIIVSGAVATLNTGLAKLLYTPTAGYHGADTLVLSNKDTVDNLTATGSVAITVNALPPTIKVPTSVSVPQGGSLTFTGVNAISVADPSGTAEQLTLSVSHGTLTLAATTGLTISGSGTASVTISGVLATLNTSLTNLLYAPTLGYHGSDTLVLSNKDSVDNLSVTGSVAITVNALPPTITAPTTVSVSQSGSLTFSGANAISVTDPSGTAEQLTLSVGHGTLTLAATTGLTITTSGTASIIVSGAVATLNTGLVKLLYTPTAGYHGPDTLVLSNKDTVDNLSATGGVAITVNALPPTIKAPTTCSVAQNGSLAFTGVNAISVTDPSGTAEQLTLSVSQGTLTLAATTGLTISGSGTASIIVSGAVATLNTGLAKLLYTPAAGYHGADALVLSNKDTVDNLSATGSVAITVNPLAPTIKAPATASINQNGSLAFTGVNAISATDPSGTAEQLTLSVTHGTLTLPATTGLTISGSNTASIIVSGVLTTLNTSLMNLLYTPAVGYHGLDTLVLSNKDTVDNLSATGSVAITVNALPPTITAPTTISVNQNASVAFSGTNAISVVDPSGTTEQLILSISHGTLKLAATTGLTIVGSGTASMTVSGALSTLNSSLMNVMYTPTAGYHGSDKVALALKDTTDNLTAAGSVAITVNPLPPTITAPSTVSVNQNASLSFKGVNAFSVADASGTTERLTLSVGQGTLKLAATTGLTISGSGTASITISGALVTLNSGIANLTYTPTVGYHGSDTLTLSNTDPTDGLTAAGTVAITVNPLAPTISAPTAISVNQNASLTFTAANALSVTDPSGTAEQLMLSVSHGTLTLAPITGLTIAGSGTGSITISGLLATLNINLTNLIYTPTAGYHGSDKLVLSNTDTTDSLTVTGSVAVTVNPLAPTITVPTTVSVNQNASVAFSGANAFSVADASGTAEQLTLSVSHGALKLAATAGLTIMGSGTATITISGALTTLNSSLVNLTYTPTAGYHGSDTLTLSNKDTTDSLTVAGSVAIVVNALPPTITAPATVSVNQNGTLNFKVATAISVADASGTAEQLTLSVSHGALKLAATAGLTIMGSGTATITISGALTTLNSSLVNLTYTPTAGYHGSDTLTLSNKDTTDSLTATGNVAITVNPLSPQIR